MGIYLVIIAAVDVNFRGEYAAHDTWWRQSGLCSFAGFLSTFSGELSVTTLTAITVDRFCAIVLPFRTQRLNLHRVKLITAGIWLFVLTICLAPYFDNSYFGHFYGQSEMCQPMPITSDRHLVLNGTQRILIRPDGWEYSVFIFIGINGLSFLIILILYVSMFISVKKIQSAARSAQLKTDLALARKMMVIVTTDALCWMPVIGLGIYCLRGNAIDPRVSL